MEFNGLANIYAIVQDLQETGKMSDADFEVLEKQIFLFKKYLHFQRSRL